MNQLSLERRVQVVKCLIEGCSIRSTVRMTGVAKNTIAKLLYDLGVACSAYQDEVLRGLPLKDIQMDEIWSFVGMKAANVPEERKGEEGIGDVYTWVAMDSDSKLVFSWLVGSRSREAGYEFLGDAASRVTGRPQVNTDGLGTYRSYVPQAFKGEVDHVAITKVYGADDHQRRYSPPECIGMDKQRCCGKPDLKKASTSYIERQNLTMRMSMKRFTRLTNAFSKKVENHAAAVSLHIMSYNFCRRHSSLRETPAVAAGVTDHEWMIKDVVRLLDR